MLELTGYADRLSASAGDTVAFYVNSEHDRPYRADLVRVRHGDTNPAGPGYREQLLESPFAGEHAGRRQQILAGSYVVVPASAALALTSFTLQSFVFATTPGRGVQGLVTKWLAADASGFGLFLGEQGAPELWLGDGAGKRERLSSGQVLRARVWYLVAASYDADSGEASIFQQPLPTAANGGLSLSLLPADEQGQTLGRRTLSPAPAASEAPLLLAAYSERADSGRRAFGAHFREAPEPIVLPVQGGCFNGKLDSPALAARALATDEIWALAGGLARLPAALAGEVVTCYDFAANITRRGIPSTLVVDLSPRRLHGYCVNLPARGMTGHNWTGEEMSYVHAPEQYGAIHFHDDDVDDARWQRDFEWTVPDDLQSGVYAARLRLGESDDPAQEDYVTVFVSPRRGTSSAELALVMPTATYLAYVNYSAAVDSFLTEGGSCSVPRMEVQDLYLAEHREYGLSVYSVHSDGSGACYSTALRPLITMRPKSRFTYSPSLWGLPSDLHLTDWLEENGLPFDIWTDEDVYREGVELLSRYRVVLTGTHPEYSSEEELNAYDAYQRRGGRWLYLGADGFYWITVYHPDNPNIIEVRKGEAGTRAWTAGPGEYSNAFDGRFGGMWRARGRMPSKLCGLTFNAYGFDVSSYYRRCPDSLRPECAWIFAGVGEDEIIGDFGLVGGAAAGLEIDRYDLEAGTPPQAYLLARSEGHTDLMLPVTEETHALVRGYHGGGDSNPMIRADMIYYKSGNGGAVWSPGSIAWCGSLSWNDYDNNVSRITENVIRGFLTLDELP